MIQVIKKGQKFKTIEEDRHFTFYLGRKPSVLMQRMYDYLNDSVELTSLLHESIDVLKNVTNATGNCDANHSHFLYFRHDL